MVFAPFKKIISKLLFQMVHAADDVSGDREDVLTPDIADPGDFVDPSAEIVASEAPDVSAEALDTAPEEETADMTDDAPPVEVADIATTPEEETAETTDDAPPMEAADIATMPEDITVGPEEAAAETEDVPTAGADQDKLHTKALRFANGRTGLIGLLRRCRDMAMVAFGGIAKIFTRSKLFASKNKTKLNVSKDMKLALSGDEQQTAQTADSTDTVQSEQKTVAADAADTKMKPGRKPSAKPFKFRKETAKEAGDAGEGTPAPVDKAAAKKAKDKEKAAAKKAKDNEKKAAKKAKDDAKKAAKQAKEDAKKAAKEAKEAAFAEKNPKKAAKRAEQAVKKEAKKAAKDAKKKEQPDKAAKAAAKAAKKAKKEENKKPKLTKEEKFQLKLDKQASKHEKKIAKFEKKAQKIDNKLEKKREKKEAVQAKQSEEKSIKKEHRRIQKERKREIKKQKKYWLERGVGRTKRNISVILLVVLIITALTASTTFLYKSDRINIPILNSAVQAIIDSPVMTAVKFLEKPFRTAVEYVSVPVSYIIHLIQGEPKIEDMYFFEAANMERYEAFKEANPELPSDEIVWRVNAGMDLRFYQDPVRVSDFSKQPVLVNKFHNLSAEYIPENLQSMPGSVLMKADAKTVEAFSRMQAAAAAENLKLTAASAYRSYEYENLLYNPRVSDTREKPDNVLARPGFGENQTGLSLDLSVDGGRMYDFAGTPEAAWVTENAEKYGFIVRYPQGQEDVTGFRHQPWHIRYVGDDVIKVMRENNIATLEEYCVKYVDHKPGDTPEKLERTGGGMTEGADGPI